MHYMLLHLTVNLLPEECEAPSLCDDHTVVQSKLSQPPTIVDKYTSYHSTLYLTLKCTNHNKHSHSHYRLLLSRNTRTDNKASEYL